jgi:hypothetical protein
MKRVVLLAGAAAYVGGALWFVGGGTSRDLTAFASGSVFNETSTGLSLAHRYLGGRARTLSRRLEPQATEPEAAVLRFRPRHEGHERKGPPSMLTPGERDWVMAGGRLVLALDADFGPLRVPASGAAAPAKVFPVWPGVSRFEARTARVLGGGLPAGTRTLVARGRDPFIAVWRHGRGEVVFLASPESLENGGLARADHLALLEALAAGRSAVYFDEYAHGLREDLDALDLLARWGFGPTLLALALLAGTVFWRERVRVGAPDADRREAPADAVDLLDSLAQLYDRALGGQESLRLYQQHLSRAVAHETGLRGDALAARVQDMTGGAGTAPVFSRALQALNDGYRRLKHAQAR